MSLTEKTTHAEESVARLLSQFKDKTKLEGVVAAQADQTQDEETAFFELLENRSIANGVGVQLDGIGDIVGEERKGKDDATYRIYLYARILVNKSSGTAPEINEIADLLIADANIQEFVEHFPAAWTIIVADEFPTDIDAVADLLGDAKAGGVRAFIEYTDEDDDYTFTFADADVIQSDGAKGFAGDQSADEILLNDSFTAWTADDPDNWTVLWESGATHEISEVGTGLGHGGGGNNACNIFSSAGGLLSMSQTFATTAGYRYQVRLNISFAAGGQVNVESTPTGDIPQTGYTTTGEKVIDFTATGASVTIHLTNNSANVNITVDDVSVIPLGGVWADVVEA
jgi:hypothetical protein